MDKEVNIIMKIFKVIGYIILGVVFVTVAIFVTQYLWNWLVPDLFNGPSIGFWQTAGLLALSKILFSGLGCHHKDEKKKKSDSDSRCKGSWKDNIRNEIKQSLIKDKEKKDAKKEDESLETSV